MDDFVEIKLFEIRDRATFLPVMAVKMYSENDGENYLLKRTGFSFVNPLIAVCTLHQMEANYDPYEWGRASRTMFVAHQYIQENFDDLKTGDVVDVECILGETTQCKISERWRGVDIGQ